MLSDDSRTARIDRRVRALSRVELRDMGAYYCAIAAMAAELAADRSTDDDIQHLHATIDGVDVASEASTRRGEGTFRLEIAALSQSARLVREELRLQAEFAPLLWLCLREPVPSTCRRSTGEHLRSHRFVFRSGRSAVKLPHRSRLLLRLAMPRTSSTPDWNWRSDELGY